MNEMRSKQGSERAATPDINELPNNYNCPCPGAFLNGFGGWLVSVMDDGSPFSSALGTSYT